MGILSRLSARHFRNLSELDIELAPGMNLLTGQNGQGKTNVLEAVCYLALLRSFRTRSVADLVQWEHDTLSVKGWVRDEDPAFSVDLSVTQGATRSLRVNGDTVSRASDFINRFICVPLVPEDIDLIKGSAAVRRRFLDIALSQTRAGYLLDLQRYGEALRSRNALLRRKGPGDDRLMQVYEEMLLRYGGRLEACRRQYVQTFGKELEGVSRSLLAEDEGGYSVRYQCSGIARDSEELDPEKLASLLGEGLARHRERDLREGYTTVGPQRGELVVRLRGKAVADFGSEGECRLGALALRLTSLHEISSRDAEGRCIVVLVDDVIGELDDERREHFIEALSAADQVMLSATKMPRALQLPPATHYQVKNGLLEAL